ncbi:MAG TPA: hypothetical protein VIK00_05110, partial [Candidatus Limnocylindrales bacterium]
RPAIYTQFEVGGHDYYQSDEWRDWLIAPSDSTERAYEIRTKFRGPGNDALGAALDRLIQSVHLASSVNVGELARPDCGDPFPVQQPSGEVAALGL